MVRVVVEQVDAQRVRILVVDDGSSDGTADVARGAGAEVLVHEVNKGKGGALATGNRWAVAQGLEWVYTMDADGQHLPTEMPSFLAAAAAGPYDVVVGNRMDATRDMPWIRKKTNEFTSWVVSRLAGVRIPDSQNGYRLFRVACLEGLELRTTRYDTESEVLVRLARRGYRIGSVPVSTIYGDEKSSINPFVDTGRFFRLVAILLASRRDESRR
jgi:glycosyltransferase involved in cell wall biosynthesis